MRNLQWGSYLHDIGRGILDAVLLKTGKLTPKVGDYEAARSYWRKSVSLRSMRVLSPSSAIITSAGSGYPDEWAMKFPISLRCFRLISTMR